MKFLDKLWNAMGLFEYVEEEETKQPAQKESVVSDKYSTSNSESELEKDAMPWLKHTSAKTPVNNNHRVQAPASNVVSLPLSNQQVKVMVVTPTVFDDAQAVADHVRAAKPVVVNFEKTDPDVMKRIVDFISGTVYALNGNIQLVGNHIMVCAPNNVDIDATKNFLSTKDFEPWRQ